MGHNPENSFSPKIVTGHSAIRNDFEKVGVGVVDPVVSSCIRRRKSVASGGDAQFVPPSVRSDWPPGETHPSQPCSTSASPTVQSACDCHPIARASSSVRCLHQLLQQSLDLCVLEFDDLLLTLIHHATECSEQNVPGLEQEGHVRRQNNQSPVPKGEIKRRRCETLEPSKYCVSRRFEFGGVF